MDKQPKLYVVSKSEGRELSTQVFPSLTEREMMTCMYWMVSLSFRGRLPNSIQPSPMMTMEAIKQLARIQQQGTRDGWYDSALIKRSSQLLGRIINEESESSHDDYV
jgi:hypothetical protein